jgi:hypothetical protein
MSSQCWQKVNTWSNYLFDLYPKRQVGSDSVPYHLRSLWVWQILGTMKPQILKHLVLVMSSRMKQNWWELINCTSFYGQQYDLMPPKYPDICLQYNTGSTNWLIPAKKSKANQGSRQIYTWTRRKNSVYTWKMNGTFSPHGSIILLMWCRRNKIVIRYLWFYLHQFGLPSALCAVWNCVSSSSPL